MSAGRDETARRQARTVTIRQRNLVALVLAAGVILAVAALGIGVILSAAGAEPPPYLVIALALMFVLSAALSFVRSAGFYIRRSRRRRRLRRSRSRQGQ